MQNVEFKAELRDPALARAALRAAGAWSVATLRQHDSYFRVLTGRLKKRESHELRPDGTQCDAEATEYVRYDRHDRPQPKVSRFAIYSDNEFIERFGAAPLPVLAVVKKTRELWLAGRGNAVRVHLDAVDGLGTFLELESLVTRTLPVARAHDEIGTLRELLAPAIGEPIACSYADLAAHAAAASADAPPNHAGDAKTNAG